ncbi:MAG: hypothetical protein ACYDDO_01125 [Acidiferrobacterales bacterium]
MQAIEPAQRAKRMDSGQYKLLLLTVILGQIAGFAVLWMKIPQPVTVVKTAAVAPAIPAVDPNSIAFATKVPQEQILRDSIDSVLKQELAPYLAEAAAAHAGTAQQAQLGASGRRAASAASVQAAQRCNAVVDRALAIGVWTDADSGALLRAAPQLSETQRVALLDKIFGAINQQQLKPVGSLPSL